MFMKNGTYLALKNRNETQFFVTSSVDGSVSQYEERLQNKASSQKKLQYYQLAVKNRSQP